MVRQRGHLPGADSCTVDEIYLGVSEKMSGVPKSLRTETVGLVTGRRLSVVQVKEVNEDDTVRAQTKVIVVVSATRIGLL